MSGYDVMKRQLQKPLPPPPPPWQEAKKTELSVIKVFQSKNELLSYLLFAENYKKNISVDPETVLKN